MPSVFSAEQSDTFELYYTVGIDGASCFCRLTTMNNNLSCIRSYRIPKHHFILPRYCHVPREYSFTVGLCTNKSYHPRSALRGNCRALRVTLSENSAGSSCVVRQRFAEDQRGHDVDSSWIRLQVESM
jgi:hypothetical protein